MSHKAQLLRILKTGRPVSNYEILERVTGYERGILRISARVWDIVQDLKQLKITECLGWVIYGGIDSEDRRKYWYWLRPKDDSLRDEGWIEEGDKESKRMRGTVEIKRYRRIVELPPLQTVASLTASVDNTGQLGWRF